MSDNILTKDRSDANLDIAAKDIAGVQFPRNILVAPDGTDLTPLTDAQLRASAVPVNASSLDATVLFTGAINATGPGAWIDTTGYTSLVMQISGTARFLMYAEVSNDQTNVDYVLILSCDEVAVYDNIDSQGVYTVRPAAKYIRYNVTQISGSISGTIVGRTHESVAAVDMLTMAMDRAHGLPLHVSLDDMSLGRLNPSNQPMKQIGFYQGTTIVPINTQLLMVDCSLYGSLAFYYSIGTSGVITPAWSHDGTTWVTATLNNEAQAGSTTMSAGTGYRVVNVMARYFRLMLTTASSGGLTQVMLFGMLRPISTSPTTQPVSGTVTANAGTGTMAVSLAASSNATSTAYEASRVVKGSAGTVWGFSGYNSLASAQFIQFYNSATLPADAAVPVFVMSVPASSNFSFYFGPRGRSFATGIVIGNSTTGPTKTIGAANCFFDVQFT